MADKKRKWANTRVKAAMMRLFNSAKTEVFWSSWSKSITTIDQAIHEDWEALVARSREQYANNVFVKRFVRLAQTNIVGEHGISVQSMVRDRRDQPDLPVQRVIEDAWKDFSRSVTAANHSRMEFEKMIVQGCAIDGEVFVRPVVSKKFKYGIKFEVIDPILCPVQYHDADKNIRHGVEFDSLGQPVAYYFADAPIKKTIWAEATGRHYENLKRVPASQIWHVYDPEWIGQKRGVPWTATALGKLKDLDGYVEAAIINARVGASKMGFFETEGNGEYTGDQDAYGNMTMEAEPGSFEVLPEGLKLSSWNPDYPHQQFGEFVTASLRGIAADFGVSHHSLSGDMSGVNYSSARIASLDERDGWKTKQEWLINRLTRPMFEAFLTYAIDMGKLTFKGNPLREQPEFYFTAAYQGRRWQWVDPAKEATRAEKAVALNILSRSYIIREQGLDPDQVFAEIAAERQKFDELGISYDNGSEAAPEEVDDEQD